MKTINLKTISDFMSEKEMKKIKGGLDENDNFADTPGEPGGGGGGGNNCPESCSGGCTGPQGQVGRCGWSNEPYRRCTCAYIEL